MRSDQSEPRDRSLCATDSTGTESATTYSQFVVSCFDRSAPHRLGMSDDLASELLQIAHALPAQANKPTDVMNTLLARLRSSTSAQQQIAVSLRDPAGRTALHHVAIAGAFWAVEPLLSAGADLHAQDGQGQTPLHLCLKAATDHRKSAPHSSSASSSSSSSASSSSSSSPDCFLQCARLIMDRAQACSATTVAPGEQASKRARTDADSTASADGTAVSSSSSVAAVAAAAPAAATAAPAVPPPSLMSLADSFDRLPLHWAVACGDDSLVLSCLDALRATAAAPSAPSSSASSLPPPTPLINAATRSGDTPLHWACADGRANIVDMLLSAGADPSLRNARDETAADLCAKAGQEALRATLQQWEQKRAAAAAAAAPVASSGAISASSLSRNAGTGSMGGGNQGAKKKVAIKLKK